MSTNYYKPRRRLLENPEDILQASCFRWFDMQYPKASALFFAIPNGGRRPPVTAKRMKATGQRAGVADAYLSIPRAGSHGLYIEFKVPGRYQSDEQKEFQKQVTTAGYKYVLIRTFEAFKSEVEDYLYAEMFIPD